jgi:hypothetical protein
LRRAFREHLGRFENELCSEEVPVARQALSKVIDGRIRFTPAEQRGEPAYRLHWTLVTTASAGGYIGVASARGFEPG